jgi:hypothetical protein
MRDARFVPQMKAQTIPLKYCMFFRFFAFEPHQLPIWQPAAQETISTWSRLGSVDLVLVERRFCSMRLSGSKRRKLTLRVNFSAAC